MQLIKEQPEKTSGEKFSSGCFISCLSWYFLWNKGPLCIFKQIGLILIIFQTQHSCNRDAANILYVRIICRSSQWRCSNLSGWKEETWKNSGLNGNRTHDLCDTGAAHLFLSDRQVTSISVISVYPGLSLRAVNRNTCYGWVFMMGPQCYGWTRLGWNTFTTMIYI